MLLTLPPSPRPNLCLPLLCVSLLSACFLSALPCSHSILHPLSLTPPLPTCADLPCRLFLSTPRIHLPTSVSPPSPSPVPFSNPKCPAPPPYLNLPASPLRLQTNVPGYFTQGRGLAPPACGIPQARTKSRYYLARPGLTPFRGSLIPPSGTRNSSFWAGARQFSGWSPPSLAVPVCTATWHCHVALPIAQAMDPDNGAATWRYHSTAIRHCTKDRHPVLPAVTASWGCHLALPLGDATGLCHLALSPALRRWSSSRKALHGHATESSSDVVLQQ
jgi:hypothetical protein